MRTIVYVDGFNLYYGACRAPGRKWLDLAALCECLLPNDEIVEIAYCTANIKKSPANPGKQDRQRIYHRALETIPNLRIYRGHFLSKEVTGPLVNPAPDERLMRVVQTFEEKGTDVNIASLMLKDGYEGRYEQAVLISNDSDLKMPVEIIRSRLDLPVVVINPVLRRTGNPSNAMFCILSHNSRRMRRAVEAALGAASTFSGTVCAGGGDLLGGGAPEGGDWGGFAFGLEAGALRDQVGEDGDCGGVAEGGKAVEAEGVEVVAGEQGEVGVVAGEQARLLVMEQVALAHGLDNEGVLGGGRGRAGAGGGEFTQLRRLGRVDHMR